MLVDHRSEFAEVGHRDRRGDHVHRVHQPSRHPGDGIGVERVDIGQQQIEPQFETFVDGVIDRPDRDTLPRPVGCGGLHPVGASLRVPPVEYAPGQFQAHLRDGRDVSVEGFAR